MTGVFDPADLHLLLPKTTHNPKSTDPPAFPWTWEALTEVEAAALARLLDVYVSSYNAALATDPDELVPPCWRCHDGLARELAVQFWLYYTVHHHIQASPTAAAEFYGRHLPGFRGRVKRLLGRSPVDCQRGEHPETWRKNLNQYTADYEQQPRDAAQDAVDIDRLRGMHFGLAP